MDNPYAMASQLENESVVDLFQGSVYGDLKIVKGLKFRSSVGANINNGRYGRYYPRTLERGRGGRW